MPLARFPTRSGTSQLNLDAPAQSYRDSQRLNGNDSAPTAPRLVLGGFFNLQAFDEDEGIIPLSLIHI